jgi:hypothetical protein
MAQAPRRGDTTRGDDSTIEQRLHEAVERGRATARETEDRLRTMAEAEENVFGLWLEIGQDQMRHNLETWQSLASVRDMHALVELQSEYLRLSFSRLAQLMAKQAEFAMTLAGAAGQSAVRDT